MSEKRIFFLKAIFSNRLRKIISPCRPINSNPHVLCLISHFFFFSFKNLPFARPNGTKSAERKQSCKSPYLAALYSTATSVFGREIALEPLAPRAPTNSQAKQREKRAKQLSRSPWRPCASSPSSGISNSNREAPRALLRSHSRPTPPLGIGSAPRSKARGTCDSSPSASQPAPRSPEPSSPRDSSLSFCLL